MTIEQLVLEKLRELPPEKQRQVLEFTASLQQGTPSEAGFKGLEGLWSDLDFALTDGDIAEARREMWSSFLRDVS